MSELKRCPFCDVGLYEDGMGFYLHPINGCLLDGLPIQNEEGSIERWNTRKPLDRIVEQLEAEKEKALKLWDNNSRHKGYKHAIEIVKEEGGLHE